MSFIDISNRGVPERLAKIRKSMGWSQAELADRAGINTRTISDIENGYRTKVQEKTLFLIASALDITLEELLSEPEEPTPRHTQSGYLGDPGAGGRKQTSVSRIKVLLLSVLIVTSVIIYKAYSKLSVSRARWEIRGKSIAVYDGVFGFKLWEEQYASNLSFWKRVIWRGRPAMLYGLDAEGSDGGRVFIKDIRTGKDLFVAEADAPALDCVFGGAVLSAGGFTARNASLGDICGDDEPELVIRYIHGRYYPSFISFYDSSRRRIGTYYHFGHFNDVHLDDIDGDGKMEVLVAGTNNMPVYKGATLLLIDDEFGEGASVDTFVTSRCKIEDAAEIRIVFPNFNEAIMDLLDVERIRATFIKTSLNAMGNPIITIAVGAPEFNLIVALDKELYPVSCSLSDNLAVLLRKLPPSRRPPDGYFKKWLSGSIRFERGQLASKEHVLATP